MGVDAEILVRTKDGSAPRVPFWCENHVEVVPPYDGLHPKYATHYLRTVWRVYREDYERGPWPLIASLLLALLEDDAVTDVWYEGDDMIGSETEPINVEFVNEINLHYVKHGRCW